MANRDSDFSKPFTDIFDMLPSVYQTDVNRALADNVFNKYLTKPEIDNIVGVVGSGGSGTQIPEIDPHRQAFQLQPLIYNKIATVDHLSSFKDIIRESVRLGVNGDRVNEWANALEFNFIPPIDIDKSVNYRDYYWLSETTPQYITICNRLHQLCTVIDQAYVDNVGLSDLVLQYMAEPVGLSKDALAQQIELIYPGLVLIVEEKEYIQLSDPLNQTNTDGWDALQWDPTFQGDWDSPLDGILISSMTSSSFILSGNYVALFNITPLFTFQAVQSTNNNGLYQVAIATYDAVLNQTEVFVMGGGLNPNSPDGLIAVSLYDLTGIDPQVTGNWDMNDGTASVTIPNPYNFQLQKDPWSKSNHWTHISDIPSGVNLSLIKQAEQPILEYRPFIELNEWSYTQHNWIYQGNDNIFNVVDYAPTDQEIFAAEDQTFPTTALDLVNNTFDVDVSVYPSASVDLVIGAAISIEFVNTLTFQYYTIVNISQSGNVITATLDAPLPSDALFNHTRIHGIRYTSRGDDWKGFFHHWVYNGNNPAVPVNDQPLNNTLVPGNPLYLSETETFEATGPTTLTYNLSTLTYSVGTNELRVYVNGVRQYGTYHEVVSGNAIVFYEGIGYGTIVVEVGPAAQSDARRASVQLRTSTVDGYVPTYQSLVNYRLVEQQKTTTNQYPLFNMYNLDGTTSYLATPLWKFLESSSYPVNSVVNKRIVSSGTVFSYEQLLLDSSTNGMFAYSEFDESTDATPTLHTIWRHGNNNEEYVPQYVDKNRNTVPQGDPTGDWEVPDQMFHNLEHDNRRVLTSVDLYQHFKSVISAQVSPPGFNDDEQTRWRLLLNPNYGLGGFIKEYNDGFDTLISSTFVDNVTIATLLEFAMIRYDNQLNILRDYFEEDVVTLVTSTSDSSVVNLQSTINDHIISRFEINGARDNVFGDSTTYNELTGKGIRNWVPTLPYVKLTNAVEPKLVVDSSIGLIELRHHDGHVSNPQFENTIERQMIGAILKQPNTSSGTRASRPLTATKGWMYYSSDTNELFKYNVISVGSSAPTNPSDGVFWYNTTTNQLFEQIAGTYVVSVDQEAAWMLIDLSTIHANVLLEVENRLYSNVPSGLNYDIAQVTSDSEFAINETKQFVKFAKRYHIVNPLASDYDPTNAFTWNYKSVDIVDYDIAAGNTPTEWISNPPSRWYDIYEGVYNTRIPHLEPWVLQGYTVEPSWWSLTYAGTTRRWSLLMWNTIASGIVPVGKQLPNGLISTGVAGEATTYNALSVNVTDNTTVEGGYGPDDLFPPYYNSSIVADDAIAAQSGIMLINAPLASTADDPYLFGDNGPTEDAWRRSILYRYNLAEIAYITQPMRFVFYAMGNNLLTIDGLIVDTDTNKIPSHRDTIFHGDIVNGQPVQVNGINQWYIEHLRFNSLDSNTSDFKTLWKSWTPRLAYQSGAFIDTNVISISTDSSILDESDITVLTKRTPGLQDSYIDALNVVISAVGTNLRHNGVRIPVNQGNDWDFRITTPNPSTESIKLYSVNSSTIKGSFKALNGSNTNDIWNHYEIDKTNVLEFIPNSIVSSLGSDYAGIQGVINLIDGYTSYLEDHGFNFNTIQYSEIDTEYGRTINWQLETERLIDQLYVGMASDQLPVEFLGLWNYVFADTINDNFMITGTKPLALSLGSEVQLSTTGTLPAPFTADGVYYVVNVVGSTLQLASTVGGTPIQILTSGQGTHSIGGYRVDVPTPATFHEVNPFRNLVNYDHTIGVIADLHTGPFIDIRNQQGIYDQYGRPVSPHHVKVFRGDTSSRVIMDSTIPNDVIVSTSTRDNLHIGGMHVFVDGYEHAILLSTRTVEGNLLFDEFLGSSINRLSVNFRRQSAQTFRPNIGGHYLLGDNMYQNMEAAVNELQMFFDTNVANEDSAAISAARKLIGFEHKDYLDNMGITSKSQLLFYRGAIQQKGSTNAVKAFINSRQFIDANVDEFWAYKLAEYGDSRPQVYPEIKLQSTDTQTDKLMLHFGTDDPTPPNFIRIELTDDTRWYNQPGQLSEIFTNEPNLFFDAEVTDTISFTDVEVGGGYIKLPTICDATTIVASQPNHTLQYISNGSSSFTVFFNLPIITRANSVLVNVNGTPSTDFEESLDGLSITLNNTQVGDIVNVSIRNATLREGIHYRRVNSTIIHFSDNPISGSIAYTAYCLNPAKTKLNPVKLIDYKSDTNVKNIPVWDPARGHHYHTAESIVTHQGDDPAFYTDNLTMFKVDRNAAWLQPYVGKVWWDTSKLGYTHYYDQSIIPEVDHRINTWGKLADWSTINLYEWVESPVHPSAYETYTIAQQQGGKTISGIPKRTLYTRLRDQSVGGSGLFDTPWTEVEDVILTVDIATSTGTTITMPPTISNGQTVTIYRNGLFHSYTVVNVGSIIIPIDFVEADTITIILPSHIPTTDELAFDPLVKDDLTINVQYKYDYRYAQQNRISTNGIDTDITYFFWASNTATSHHSTLLRSAENQLANIPVPFVIFQNLLPSNGVLPNRYDQSIFRGIVHTIQADDRFKLRYTKDYTLRDDIEDSPIGLKTTHVDWGLIRERQKFNIDKVLWDKLTEAVAGRKLVNGVQSPVPTLDRVLFDDIHQTTHRFGLRDGQSFVDQTSGIAIILASIADPSFDLFPVDREQFLRDNLFDTPINIETSMNLIYTTFLPEHINRIWFAALHDGLATNSKYTDIFKTSWIQLDGVRLLDTTGVLA